MSTRIGQIEPFPAAFGRQGNLRWIVIAACVVVGLMFYVGGKVQIVRLGYQIDELEKQKRELERANRELQIEASSLAAPARVEEIATTRFGMVRPSKDSIVVVKRRLSPDAERGKQH